MEPPEPTTQQVVSLLPALAASVFYAASSMFGSLPNTRLLALAEALEGNRQRAIQRYVSNPARVEARWLVIRATGMVFTAASVASQVPDPAWLWSLAVVLATYALPGAIGSALLRRNAERAAPILLSVLRPIEWLAALPALPLEWVDKVLSRPNGTKKVEAEQETSIRGAEMELIVNEGELNGALASDQSEMIRNILDFRDMRAGEVMLPRLKVVAIEADTPLHEVLELVAKDAYSRYPVYRERIDNVVGFLHVKDLLSLIGTQAIPNHRAADLMRTPVVYVPETQSASSVLTDMRTGHKHHIAIVIDEFGGMAGIITLEDIIERIVGDIRDEHDDPEEERPIVDLGEGKLLVDARVPVVDLARHLGTEFPTDGDYYSLGGFIVEALGRVPAPGETLSTDGFDFIVRDADERHIAKVEIVRQPTEAQVATPRSSLRARSVAS